jgi:hypothetical protein
MNSIGKVVVLGSGLKQALNLKVEPVQVMSEPEAPLDTA